MSRSEAARIADVRALLQAARRVADDRGRLVPSIARTSGLSPEGVELAFTHHLELEPSDADLTALVRGAGDASRVHVILSANVFVGALRALAVAFAASTKVTVKPSRREPVFARALVEALARPEVALAESMPLEEIEAGEVHVYGRDETLAEVRARARPGVVVRGHGPGLGVALVSDAVEPDAAAAAVARDVVPFDQRGCLSPRIVFVLGDEGRARVFATRLSLALGAAEGRVPRGLLAADEREQARRYVEAVSFGGELWRGAAHVVGVLPGAAPLLLPPPGRHVHVTSVRDTDDARQKLVEIVRFVAAVGTDCAGRFAAALPAHARVSALGAMQRPRLDGPVDLRP